MATDSPADPSQQVLSQSEVEALLSQVAAAETPAPPAAGAAPAEASRVRRFEVRAPSFLSAAEQRQLRLRHEDHARAAVTRLSIYLRQEIAVRLVELHTLSWRKLVDGLPARTHLTLFQFEPLAGVGVLEVPPALGLALVDRLLGGPGKPANLDRDFTEIEIAVLDLAVQLLLKEWGLEVLRAPALRLQISGHETQPRFLQWSDPDGQFMRASLEVRFNDTTGTILLAVPSALLEPVLGPLRTASETRRVAAAPAATTPPPWQAGLAEVPVPLHAAWKGLELTARELAQLQVGDVLQLDPRQVNRVEVTIGRVPKFCGRLGTRDQSWAIELTGLL